MEAGRREECLIRAMSKLGGEGGLQMLINTALLVRNAVLRLLLQPLIYELGCAPDNVLLPGRRRCMRVCVCVPMCVCVFTYVCVHTFIWASSVAWRGYGLWLQIASLLSIRGFPDCLKDQALQGRLGQNFHCILDSSQLVSQSACLISFQYPVTALPMHCRGSSCV